jgi:anti-sigma factor (TIGR02949 family)
METCKEVLDALTEYLEGDLRGAENGQFETHMDDCGPCVAFFRTYRKSSELARETLKVEDVPPELQARVRSYLRARLGLANQTEEKPE